MLRNNTRIFSVRAKYFHSKNSYSLKSAKCIINLKEFLEKFKFSDRFSKNLKKSVEKYFQQGILLLADFLFSLLAVFPLFSYTAIRIRPAFCSIKKEFINVDVFGKKSISKHRFYFPSIYF